MMLLWTLPGLIRAIPGFFDTDYDTAWILCGAEPGAGEECLPEFAPVPVEIGCKYCPAHM